MSELFAVLRNRLPFFLALFAIIVAYLYSYSAGYRNALQTFAYLFTVASLPWFFRPLPGRADPPNSETQPPGFWLPRSNTKTQFRINEFLAFFSVVIFGVVLRFWRWDFVPMGLLPDELLFTANGLRILDGAPAHFLGVMPLIPEKPGWMPIWNFYNYYVALNVKLFGSGHFGVKMLSILPGCATLPAFYWLLREIRGPRLAAIGTLMLSMSRWHLTHSRINYAMTLMVAVDVFALASLFCGLRTRRLHWIALGGILLGLSPYFYVTGWLVAAGAFSWLGILTVFGQNRCPRFRSHALSALIVCVFSFLVTAAPNLFYLCADTAVATSRPREVSGGIVDFDHHTVDWKKAASRIRQHVEAVVVRGADSEWSNIPGEPLILPIVTALSIVGACAQLAIRCGVAHAMTWSIVLLSLLGALTRGNEVRPHRILFILPIFYLWAAHGLEIIESLLRHLGSLISARFAIIKASWVRYAIGSVLGVAILFPGLLDVYDYFARFSMLGASHPRSRGNEVLLSKAAEQYIETHQIWIDFALRLHHLGGPNLKRSGFDVLLWRPKKELDGKISGGLDDPSYQMVYFKNWESFPYPKADKPIAFLSSVKRPSELANVFESLESREFPNWYETDALFSISFIDPGELRAKLAEIRANPEETPETFWLLDTPREELEWMQKGHGLMGTYYDGNVWSDAADTLSPTASCRSCVLFTMPSSTIDFTSLQPRSSVEWQGLLQIDRSDEYLFATESIGGSAVYVDGRRVVDNWEPTNRIRTREGKLHLESGFHALTIRYDSHASGARFRFLWKTGDEPFAVVPAENLRISK